MLKIKDSVDLKELEKFKFKKESYLHCYTKDVGYDNTCFINIESREIWFGSEGVVNKLDILFDLIQAGLVEKVKKQ